MQVLTSPWFYVLLTVAAAAYLLTRNRGPRVPPANEVAFSTVGEGNARLDATFGSPPAQTIKPLAPLPELMESEAPRAPGSPLFPAVFLRFSPRPRDEVIAMVAEAGRKNPGAWETLVAGPDGDFEHTLHANVAEVSALACGIDIVLNVQIDEDSEQACENLQAGVAQLVQSLGAQIEGEFDADAVLSTIESIGELREQAGAAVDLDLVAAQGPFRAADVHHLARGLGFDRSDLGSYAWYSSSDIGDDILLTIRPGNDLGMFEFENPEARYDALSFGFDIDQVPMPDVIAERLWQTVSTFQNKLGGRVVSDAETGSEVDAAWLRRHVRSAMAKLSERGMLVAARAVPEGEM